MFYSVSDADHGLPHDPIKALIAPRPIGWISSISKDGIANLAPYSFFNIVCDRPALVMFASYGSKDSQINIEQTGEFICNVASWDLRERVHKSGATVPPDVDEFDLVGLSKQSAELVNVPRVAEAPAHLECQYIKTVDLETKAGKALEYSMILGEVVGVHIDDQYITDKGLVSTAALKPLTRMGYREYGGLGDVIEMAR